MTNPSPGWTLYDPYSQSYFLPYANSSFGSQTAIDPEINVTLNGQIFTAPLDTGSRGVSIPQASVPNITQSADDPSGFLFYWSSGRKIEGYWKTETLAFPDATGSNTGSLAATAVAPVLIVQQIVDEAGDWPNGSRATNQTIIPTAGTSFLNFGIGFDRTGDGTSPENGSYNQQYDPFLNLAQMTSGDMLAGYILTQSGVQLGLTATNTAPGADNGQSPFAYDKLIPTGYAQVPGSPPDWQAGTGSVTFSNTPYASGQLVLDIGIGNALISLPSPPAPPSPSSATTVSNGSTVTVNFLNSDYNVGYTFVVGNTIDALTPQNLTWSALQPGNFSENQDQTTFFNTGRNAINGFNYLYDATNGYIGLQLNAPTAQTGAFLTPVVALQGSVALPAGFSASYPVLLQAATTITVPGSAVFAGVVSGDSPLTITGGIVQLDAASSFTGGVLINPGAELELANSNAAGSGPIQFGGIGATLLIDTGVTPTATIGNLQQGDFIDIAGINTGTVAVTGNLLTVSGGSIALTLTLDTNYSGQFRASPDGGGGTLISYTASAQPYVLPIYHETEPVGGKQNLLIYASLNGGPLDPYLLDTGSPNMFSVYGSWWPGNSTELTQPGSNTITFASGTSYSYNTVTTNVALGTGAGGTIVAAANNVNVGLITNIGSATPAESFSSWASAVAAGDAPIGSDQSYGNMGAGLFGSNSLATVLEQIPVGTGLKNGFIIQSGGVSATAGTLTIGLDPGTIATWEAQPNTIIMQMATSGVVLPNPDGNATAVQGYEKAQVVTTQVILIANGNTFTHGIPLVLDTGGGNNNIIYPDGTLDLSGWVQNGASGGPLNDNTEFQLIGTTTANAIAPILNYLTGPNALPAGGNTVVDPAQGGGLRVNPGISLFYDYNVMFDLQDGLVLLQPITCFAAGTRIETSHGLVAVENLREGDLVMTRIGLRHEPIRWIGFRRVDCNAHPRPESVWPVQIVAGAFGPDLPFRDLYLSPDHAVYIDGVLIPIKYLCNGTTIVRVPKPMVTYYHIELSHHDVVMAEGLPVESYLDVYDRSAFDNGGAIVHLHADFAMRRWEAVGCAELVVTGAIVQALREDLLRRSARSPSCLVA